jgi:F420-0:gamma-glutamyl ligase
LTFLTTFGQTWAEGFEFIVCMTMTKHYKEVNLEDTWQILLKVVSNKMLIIQYMMFSLVVKTRELFGCAAAGVFISNISDAQNVYYNTSIIASVCELRANIKNIT